MHPQDPSLKYTMCFIQRQHELLLLNRHFAPNMGLWTGPGGKIEAGESPEACALREVREETGIELNQVRFAGLVSWETEHERAGMAVFVAVIQKGYSYQTPRWTNEGILDWKETQWVIDEQNSGVPVHVSDFLSYISKDQTLCRHHYIFHNGSLTARERTVLTDGWAGWEVAVRGVAQ